MIEVLARDGLYLVDTEHTPRKWLSDVVPKTAVEGVVFIAFASSHDEGPPRDVLLRLGSIESVQDAR